jgi:1-acyl-sn-glycerol-3-phosphate acyltransferase
MCRFFEGVMRRQMAGAFRAVRVARPGPPDVPADAPLIVYANHPSWWDPAFFMVLATGPMRERVSYGVIEAAALERYGFMKRIGLFGVEPGTREGAVRFLRVGRHVLAQPRAMIWMTAQGEFADPRAPVALRPGLAHLMARVPGAVAVPLAVEYPFWTEKRPEALCEFGAPVRAEGDVEASTDRLRDALQSTVDGLARRAMARDPAAFASLIDGTRGVGGIYGLWSRARARMRGERYVPDHAAIGAPDAAEERR